MCGCRRRPAENCAGEKVEEAMTLKTTVWDPANNLKSEKAIQSFIRAAFDDGDLAVIAVALGAVARARGMGKVAKDVGVTRESLYKSLSATGNPGFTTVVKVAEAVGLKLTVKPVKRRPLATPSPRSRKAATRKRPIMRAG